MSAALIGPLFVLAGLVGGAVTCFAPIKFPLRGKMQKLGLIAVALGSAYLGVPLGLNLTSNSYTSVGMAVFILGIGIRLVRDKTSIGPPAGISGVVGIVAGLTFLLLDSPSLIRGTAAQLRLPLLPSIKAIMATWLFLVIVAFLSRGMRRFS